ncbi:hypothetical protein SDC9_61435 [bioreactor metagenome]|uniref:Uncharacterized protein n=1 Tax=bioreactor metagenome TaxID=1076179 RepID=A0A644XG47_9ZZZZ
MGGCAKKEIPVEDDNKSRKLVILHLKKEQKLPFGHYLEMLNLEVL